MENKETLWAWGYSVNARREHPRYVEAADERDARRKVKATTNLRRFSGSVAPAEQNRKDDNGRWLV